MKDLLAFHGFGPTAREIWQFLNKYIINVTNTLVQQMKGLESSTTILLLNKLNPKETVSLYNSTLKRWLQRSSNEIDIKIDPIFWGQGLSTTHIL